MQIKRVIPFSILVATLFLMGPAFYNGYPLVYADTGTYLQTALTGEVPMDRPIAYGIFVRLTSWGLSLWGTILVQSFLLAFLLFQVVSIWVIKAKQIPVYLTLTAGLSLFTGVGWYASQVMADIFAPMAVLCWIILLCKPTLNRSIRIPVISILILAHIVHLSHVLISSVVLLVPSLLYVLKWRKGGSYAYMKRNLITAWILIITSGLLVPTTHLISDGSFRFSKWSHVVFMSKMLDNGILKRYLDEQCGTRDYTICAYKDQLPANSREFIWDTKKSPVHLAGGWERTQKEYGKIIRHTFFHPKYLALHALEALKATGQQLFQNPVGEGLITDWYASPSSPVHLYMSKYLPGELHIYLNSRQNTDQWGQKLDFTWLNNLHYLLLGGCLLFLIWHLTSGMGSMLPPSFQLALWLVLLGILSNAAVTASLANVYGRLQGRIIWLLPFIVVLWAGNIRGLFDDQNQS